MHIPTPQLKEWLSPDLIRLLESAPLPIFLGEADAGNIVYFNRCWCAGSPSATRRVYTIDPDDREALTQHWKAALPSQKPWQHEVRMRCCTEQWQWYRLSVTPILGLNGVVAWMGIGSPISASSDSVNLDQWLARLSSVHDPHELLLRLRESLPLHLERLVSQRTQSLQLKNSELENFVATVAHDLRAPLSAVLAQSGLAERQLGRGEIEAAQQTLQKINQSTQRMNSMLSELLTLARHGLCFEEPELLPLVDALHETLELLEPSGARRGVKVQIPAVLPSVMFTRLDLYQVLQNVLENALKFAAPNSLVRITALTQPSGLQVQIANSGRTIPREELPRVFDWFFTLHPQEGTGVGLSIVKRIMERHGGQVWVESDDETRVNLLFR